MSYTFTLPYPPSANRYWRNYNGRMVVSAEATAYKWAVREITDEIAPRCLTGKIVVHVLVYRPQKRGDLDNTLKILFDSLSGIAYEDDSQIIAIHAYRHDDKKKPRVVVTVEEVL
jgi:crossover junction endodeoxyribonuclease RusA